MDDVVRDFWIEIEISSSGLSIVDKPDILSWKSKALRDAIHGLVVVDLAINIF